MSRAPQKANQALGLEEKPFLGMIWCQCSSCCTGEGDGEQQRPERMVGASTMYTVWTSPPISLSSCHLTAHLQLVLGRSGVTSKYSESTGFKTKLRKKYQVGEEVRVGKVKGRWVDLACRFGP